MKDFAIGMGLAALIVIVLVAFGTPRLDDASSRGSYHRAYCESYCEGVGGVVLQDAELVEVRVTVSAGAGERSQVECLCGIILVDPE